MFGKSKSRSIAINTLVIVDVPTIILLNLMEMERVVKKQWLVSWCKHAHLFASVVMDSGYGYIV